ncbi:MAG: hypothetical protein KBA46_05670 [Candidatus Omnitrophica bacterium]|nr:hypothetical protein [Candidatus Omnitrophota bacterium]
MKLSRGIVVVLLVCVLVPTLSVAQEESWESIAQGYWDVQAVAVNQQGSVIIIGAGPAIVKSVDGGRHWEDCLQLRGQGASVRFLVFDQRNQNMVYAGTSDGLYVSFENAKTWKKIFKGSNVNQRTCMSLVVASGVLYLGTLEGLWVSVDQGWSWRRQKGEVGRQAIVGLAFDEHDSQTILLATRQAVFRGNHNSAVWEKVFLKQSIHNDESVDDEIEEEADIQGVYLQDIQCDPQSVGHFYLATNRGVFESRDNGASWSSLGNDGLVRNKITKVLVLDSGQLLAVAQSMVYQYAQSRWHELSLNLATDEIRALAMYKGKILLAACNNGLFAMFKNASYERRGDTFKRWIANEPSIGQVQRAAIAYADVDLKKILLWRKQAALKALLPELSVGINRDTQDLWHWESGSTTKTSDDVLLKGRDVLDWGFTLRWDLSDIVFHQDQTSIDTRSRLTVQLRDDILDDVTRLYFERIRVKIELDQLKIEDVKKRQEKELKVRELTAYLDALTDGYFSDALRQQNQPST